MRLSSVGALLAKPACVCVMPRKFVGFGGVAVRASTAPTLCVRRYLNTLDLLAFSGMQPVLTYLLC